MLHNHMLKSKRMLRELEKLMIIHYPIILMFVNRFQEGFSVKHKPGAGRKPGTMRTDLRVLIICFKRGPNMSMEGVNQKCCDFFKTNPKFEPIPKGY